VALSGGKNFMKFFNISSLWPGSAMFSNICDHHNNKPYILGFAAELVSLPRAWFSPCPTVCL
jgi:hypothetical protein